jgi:hypothetical protein
VAEAIVRSDMDSRKTLAAERATILQTLERIKPQLERLAGESALSAGSKKSAATAMPVEPPIASVESRKQNGRAICRACTHPFDAGELYCGNCGVARPDATLGGNIQSKVASLWYMQQAAERSRSENSPLQPDVKKPDVLSPATSVKPVSLQDIVAQFLSPEDSVLQAEADNTKQITRTPARNSRKPPKSPTGALRKQNRLCSSPPRPCRSSQQNARFPIFRRGHRRGRAVNGWNR